VIAAWRAQPPAAARACNDNAVPDGIDTDAIWPDRLRDLLDDPVTRSVMRADHVTEAAIVDLVRRVSAARVMTRTEGAAATKVRQPG
jgi:hypothetical protein